MKIEYKFSTADIADVLNLSNEFLKHVSIVTLSRSEAEIADAEKGLIGTGDSRYCNIVKVINRWGIKDEEGKYYELLNDVIGRISSCQPMLQIYKPIQILLFNKLLEKRKNPKAKFTKEEIEIFFLQPYEMIVCTSIPQSGVRIYDLIGKSQGLSVKLKSEDSKEFLEHGVVRRLFMLKATVDSISKIYCERRKKPLDDNEKAILSQNINFFYANIYAILDCLAFVFAFEYPNYKINRHNKKEFKKVQLFKKKFYRKINGLSEKLNLTKLKPWYDEIADLRHPVAHRIPLYFPEIYNDEDYRKIQEDDKDYFESFNSILKDITAATNEINDELDKLNKEWQKAKSNINVFSGCFLHSYEESKKFYHLSRLTLDLGILYYLLDKSIEYLCVLCLPF